MIIILKNNDYSEENPSVQKLTEYIKNYDVNISKIIGSQTTIWGLVGDTSKIDIDMIRQFDIVENVQRVAEPFKNANRKFHPDDSIIDVAGKKIGAGYFSVMAGPCSVESQEQITDIAKKVKNSGSAFLRGGAYKPRTSPYSFQGLRDMGINMLLEAKKAADVPIVTEIMDLSHLDYFGEVDIIQVGTRNMQNFELLKELGHTKKPILLKRGFANTIEEFLMSAEYIMAGGNSNIVLCERGIRSFDNKTRNVLDISAIPVIKRLSHLPIIIDPSHATGYSYLVEPMAYAAVAAGADGLMIEVHNDPQNALSDGAQSLTPEQFDKVMQSIIKRVEFEGKIMQR
ncbi:MAG: 3-deoxy-7-phosphoheptulonate synthase [Oscillospiraceae bacterium]|nr:3-deoxy-7-phosphoheptulonate synthase [Oscillospiraceae bacterium]